MNHQQVGIGGRKLGKGKHDHQHGNAQHHDQGDQVQPRTQQNAHRQRPEHIGGIQRVFDSSTETHDGQRAHHTHGQRNVALDTHNYRRGDEGKHDQRQGKGGTVQNAAVGLAVHDRNDETDHKAQSKGQKQVGRNDGFELRGQTSGVDDAAQLQQGRRVHDGVPPLAYGIMIG